MVKLLGKLAPDQVSQPLVLVKKLGRLLEGVLSQVKG